MGSTGHSSIFGPAVDVGKSGWKVAVAVTSIDLAAKAGDNEGRKVEHKNKISPSDIT